jgi:hypothetical protein
LWQDKSQRIFEHGPMYLTTILFQRCAAFPFEPFQKNNCHTRPSHCHIRPSISDQATAISDQTHDNCRGSSYRTHGYRDWLRLDGPHGYSDGCAWMGPMVIEMGCAWMGPTVTMMGALGWAPRLQRLVRLDGPHKCTSV